MSEPTPLPAEIRPNSQTSAIYGVPMPTQVLSEPDTQAVAAEAPPTQPRAAEAAGMQMPSQAPAAARSTLPPPPVELRQYAQVAGEFLQALHLQGQLIPLLKQVSRERRMLREAAAAGLSIAPEELQSAADDFRVQRGLRPAEDLAAWLQRERLTVSQFEAAIERDLLMAKLGTGSAGGAVAHAQRPVVLDSGVLGQADHEPIDWDLQILIQQPGHVNAT